MTAGRRLEFDQWSADREAWDMETGAPGIGLFSSAVQVWAILQNRRGVTVAEAAAAFNCDPLRIIEAVADHQWMLLVGPPGDYERLLIDHDGE